MLPLLNTDEEGRLIGWDKQNEEQETINKNYNVNDSKFLNYMRILSTKELIVSLADLQETMTNVGVETKLELMKLLVNAIEEES
jgi:hypothetical protein